MNNNLNAKLIQNEHIGIQEINVPSSGGMNYPEAPTGVGEPFGRNAKIQTGAKVTNQVSNANNTSRGFSHIRGTEIDLLNANYMKNSSKIMALDVKLKALNKQLDSFKWASNEKYYQVLEDKIAAQKEYQVLVEEQNLIKQEIERRKQMKHRKRGKKPVGAPQVKPMVNPYMNNQRAVRSDVIRRQQRERREREEFRRREKKRIRREVYQEEAEAECIAACCLCCLAVAVEASKN